MVVDSDLKNRRTANHFRNFRRTIETYSRSEPFARFLTRFYKENRQMGSSDRRINTRYCYNYFRLGNAFADLSLIERLFLAEFLCESQSSMVDELKPEWSKQIAQPLSDKIALVQETCGAFLDQVFPFSSLLSPSIDRTIFTASHFVQPDLYIRVKQGAELDVQNVLAGENIPYRALGNNALALPNGSKLQQLRGIDGLFEVQDWSSKQSLDELQIVSGESWWDCCAASGGKSLLLLDRFPNIQLVVSDTRMSILRNLDERFSRARIHHRSYSKKILDLSQPVGHLMMGKEFDGILVDAPCSGSGTWGRTPESLSQFNEKAVSEFSILQQSIITNVVPYLRQGGSLLYITCSVFEQENENVARFVEEELGLKLVQQRSITGYTNRADTMFVAQFLKV